MRKKCSSVVVIKKSSTTPNQYNVYIVQNKLLKHCFIFLLFFFAFLVVKPQHTPLSQEQTDALNYLDSFINIQQSAYWINIKPKLFIENLRKNIKEPVHIYPGSNTNFCSYAALSYSCVSTFPLRYVHFMIELYMNGDAAFRKISFKPSDAVQKAVGLLKFKGELDINHADQMWYMSLADHFKGYVNWFSWHYKPGAEDKFWPSTNLKKFNRMLRKICNYETHSTGSDLIRPSFKNIVDYLNGKLVNNHQVFLYVNNIILHKRKHNRIFYRIPTHYIVLLGIVEKDGLVTLRYWDYGFTTQKEMPISEFKDIVFGVIWCKKQTEK